jgi:hypothetical protein
LFTSKPESYVSPFTKNNANPQPNLFTVATVEDKKPHVESITTFMSAFKVPEVKTKPPNLFNLGASKP